MEKWEFYLFQHINPLYVATIINKVKVTHQCEDHVGDNVKVKVKWSWKSIDGDFFKWDVLHMWVTLQLIGIPVATKNIRKRNNYNEMVSTGDTKISLHIRSLIIILKSNTQSAKICPNFNLGAGVFWSQILKVPRSA